MREKEKYKEPQYGFSDEVLDELFDGVEEYVYEDADKTKRLFNFFIDQFVNFIIVLFFMIIMGGMIDYYEGLNGSTILTSAQDFSILIVFLIGLSNYLWYYIYCEYKLNGKTLGKALTGTKVVAEDGDKPAFGKIIARTICRYLPLEPFSVLFSEHQGWHDSFSGTRVVLDKPKK